MESRAVRVLMYTVLAVFMADTLGRAAKQARALHGMSRDFLARHLGEGPAEDPGSRGFHSNVYQKLGEIASSSPIAFPVAPLSLLSGLENEVVGGVSEKLQGRPFMSDRGFDWQDLEANLRGLRRGLVPGSATTQATALRSASY